MKNAETVAVEYTLKTTLPYWDKSSQPSETFTFNASLLQAVMWSDSCFHAIKELAWRVENGQGSSLNEVTVIRNLAEIGQMLMQNAPELVEKLTESIYAEHDLDVIEPSTALVPTKDKRRS